MIDNTLNALLIAAAMIAGVFVIASETPSRSRPQIAAAKAAPVAQQQPAPLGKLVAAR